MPRITPAAPPRSRWFLPVTSVEHVRPGPDGDVRLDLEQRFASRAVVQDIVSKMPPAASPSNPLADQQWVKDHASQAVKDKADKAVPQTAGNFAALTQDGNLADSKKKPADFATAEQGAKADTAVQSVAVGSSTVTPGEGGALALPVSSSATSDSEDALATPKAVKTVNDKVTAIEDKIPPQASSSNQLADKNFVNSSIATETATFRGAFNLVTDLELPLNATHEQVAAAVKTELGQADYDGNDYVFVQVPQDLEHTDAMKQVDRYKCVETGADPVVKSWEYEWTLNNSSFTAAQWAAINSGITSGDVTKLGGIAAGAQVNVIETVKVNGTALTPQDKAVNIPVPTLDDTVTSSSANGVKSSGIWSAIWGTASTAFSSLYDWAVAQLGLKRDYTDLSYDTTETVEVPALHVTMRDNLSWQVIAEYDFLCTEEVPDPPQMGHVYTWRADGAAFYITQGVSALQTTWILYSQNGEVIEDITTQNATQGFYPDVDFIANAAVITTHKTTVQKTVTVEDELALKSGIPAPSTATPAMDGTGAAGTSAAFARGDHVHPTDTSRMAASATGADIPLNPSVGAPNLNSVVNTLSTQIGEHVNDTTIHVTAAEKATWNGKQSALSAQQLANIAAVPNKANDADVVHKTGDETIAGIKRFSGSLYIDDSHGQLLIMSRGFLWSMTGGQEPEILFPTKSGTLALTADIPYDLVTKTINNGAVSLDDRASNAVTISATLSPNKLTINFPTAPTGKLRDFAMRLNIAAGVTAPEIAWPQGVTLENNGGEVPEIADGGTGGSSTILYFSESENNGTTAKFTVKGETLVAITPQA